MLGKIYLIDFWFTTCSSCLQDMKYLHTAYEKYKERGFDILSVATDEPALVNFFREGKWKMPWKNSVVPQDRKILKDFEVQTFPTPILVGADGKILVKEAEEIRGENLDRTLSKYFK